MPERAMSTRRKWYLACAAFCIVGCVGWLTLYWEDLP